MTAPLSPSDLEEDDREMPEWWNDTTPLPQPIPGKIERRPGVYGSRRALEFRWALFGGDGCDWDWDDLVYLTDSQLIKAGFYRDRTASPEETS